MDSNAPEAPSTQPETPFHDLDHYLAIPRVGGLALSTDGSRLVTTVSTLNAKGDLYFTSARPDPDSPEADPVSALWLLPADGGEARVVHSRAGGVGGVM